MEIEGTNGSKALLRKPDSKLELGRGSGFQADDRTVSRRQLELKLDVSGEPRARFLVLGRNPVWVRRRNTGEVCTFKTSDAGKMEIGDAFCVAAKNPVWFTCKRSEMEVGLEDEWDESLDIDSVDVTHIDPVKEFGFLVIGEEFNSYPERMIKDMKNWEWFLEEAREKGSDDDEDGEQRRRRKRKKGKGNEDEDWTGESEEDKELIVRATKVQKPKYSTRSKNSGKKTKSSVPRKVAQSTSNVDEDEEDDETLGGFIVNEENLEDEEIDDEEEEEELDEDEDELDD